MADELALKVRPTTLDSVVGALDYARCEYRRFKDEDRQIIGLDVDRTDGLVLHLIDGALDVLRPMAGGAAS